MMLNEIVANATSVLFFVFLIRNAVYWLYLWQVKEYRFDRLYIHLKETGQGKTLLFGIESLVKIGLFILYFITIFYPSLFTVYPYLVFLLYLYLAGKVVYDILNKKIIIPVMTGKIIVVLVLSLVGIGLLYTIPVLDFSAWLIFLDKLLPFIIGFLILLMGVPSDFYKDTVINRGIKKIRKFRKVLVIGITGSYGKGSTKEYLYTILSYKFNVLKTYSTYNTPIGISKTILNSLDSKKKIFIVEMGAYKKGDIAYMSEMVKPKIGILTAVNDQHLSLFGSFETIMKTKYELIESLPKNGLALFNGNNPNTLKLFQQTTKNKALYSSSYNTVVPKDANIIATDVQVKKLYTEFTVKIKRRNLGKFRLNLIGPHHIENLLPGLYIGDYLKMTKDELQQATEQIKPAHKTMYPYKSSKNVMLIDDTYNANPDAVKAAVEYMKIYKGKKVFVLQPMIELGKNAPEDHKEVAQVIADTCDIFITTNNNFEKELRAGIEATRSQCEFYVWSPGKIASYIELELDGNDVVVFEGKESFFALDGIQRKEVIH
jgi:UDP-N-acetylmuramoyl-tripeptide--D-alanyl-D-alanine ligase